MPTKTLSRFIKDLQALEAQGWGRAKVAVDKPSLYDGNECWTICNVTTVDAEIVCQSDDDGGTVVNKDGTERQHRAIVIRGENGTED